MAKRRPRKPSSEKTPQAAQSSASTGDATRPQSATPRKPKGSAPRKKAAAQKPRRTATKTEQSSSGHAAKTERTSRTGSTAGRSKSKRRPHQQPQERVDIPRDDAPLPDFLDEVPLEELRGELLEPEETQKPKPPRKRKKAKTATKRAASTEAPSDAAPAAAAKDRKPAAEPDIEEAPTEKKRRRRRRGKKKSVTETATVAASEPVATEPKKKAAPAQAAEPKPVREKPEAPAEEPPPKRRKKSAAKKKPVDRGQPPAKKELTKKESTKRESFEQEELPEEPAWDETLSTPEDEDEVFAPMAESEFARMGLSNRMLKSLHKAGYLEPTPIQAGLIPRALAGVDVMGQAQTGTGKTAAFGIPLIAQLHPHRKGANPQALILVPTRELAVQVRDECEKLASGQRIHVVAVYGGKPIRQQTQKLQRGAEIVVGTPGRVMDMMDRGALMLGDLRFAVLDEADRMLDIGFRPDIEKILRRCPQSRQSLLLSATLPPPVVRLAKRYMREPEELNFSPTDMTVDTIEQHYFTVIPEQKFDLLVRLLERENPTQAIVFCRTRRGTDRVQRMLRKKMTSVDAIHGDLSQSVRDRVMRQFRDGNICILVATDVVGRGIDVTRISHIINYDVPKFCDDYVHRVGRAGRMGREGVAFTFVTPEEGNELTRIEIRINRLLKRDEIAGFVTFAKESMATTPGFGEMGDSADESQSAAEAPKNKPVFGKRTRRHRRAL